MGVGGEIRREGRLVCPPTSSIICPPPPRRTWLWLGARGLDALSRTAGGSC